MTYFRVIHTIMGPKCLTAVFGMGTGVATWVWSPASRMGRLRRSRACYAVNGWKYQKGSGKRCPCMRSLSGICAGIRNPEKERINAVKQLAVSTG